MTKKLEIYKCEICGNIVQVLIEGVGTLVCCSKEMKRQEIQYDKTEVGEKHSPKIEEREGERYIQVKTHPMINEHYVQFIQVQTKDKNQMHTKFFHPGELPELEITKFPWDMNAIEYCNIHHLWGMEEQLNNKRKEEIW